MPRRERSFQISDRGDLQTPRPRSRSPSRSPKNRRPSTLPAAYFSNPLLHLSFLYCPFSCLLISFSYLFRTYFAVKPACYRCPAAVTAEHLCFTSIPPVLSQVAEEVRWALSCRPLRLPERAATSSLPSGQTRQRPGCCRLGSFGVRRSGYDHWVQPTPPGHAQVTHGCSRRSWTQLRRRSSRSIRAPPAPV